MKDYQIAHQIIDNDEEFQACMTEYLKNTSFWNKDCDYAIVSIFGAQSSGKSTLLNRLFGTQFQVMDKEVGFHQCTQGIFMSSNDELGNLVVLDVEGTDSMERQKSGEEGQAFEKRISLFALAVSDVLLINIMERDINRAQGSNYMLLQLLFELNLQIFHKDRVGTKGGAAKTLLYFVIRDYAGDIEKTKCIGTISGHMDRMWKDLFKENPQEEIKFSDCFDITYSFLPHKKHCPKEWEEKVKSMQPRFNTNMDDCVLEDNYSRKIPISGLQEYCKNTWNIIKQNKDIDLPAQREMMARYRCGEISTQIKMDFKDVLQKLHRAFIEEDEPVSHFGSSASKYQNELLTTYKKMTTYYIEKIRTEFQEKLEDDMEFELKQLYGQVLKKLRESIFLRVKQDISEKTTEESPIWPNCYLELKAIKKDVIESFEKKAKEAASPFLQWNAKFQVEELLANYQNVQERIIETQVRLRIEQAIEDQQGHLNASLGNIISKSNFIEDGDSTQEEFDESVRDVYNRSISKCLKVIDDIHKEFHIEDTPSLKDRVADSARSVVVKSFSNHANYLSNLMVKQFKEDFPPLLPTKSERIERAYNLARDRAVLLLNQYFYVPIGKSRPSLTFNFESAKPSVSYPSKLDDRYLVLNEGECTSIFKDFMAEIVVLRLQAEHENERKNAHAVNIPWYLWLFLLILGWNELVWIIKNPLYLFLVLLFVVLVFGVRLRSYINEQYVHIPWWARTAIVQVNTLLPANYRLLNEEAIPEKEKEKKKKNDE